MPRLLAVLLTVAATSATVLLSAPDASAAPSPTVSPSTVRPGGSFTVSGTGCWDPAYDPASGEEAQWVVVVSTAFGTGSFETTGIPGGAWSVTVQVSPSFAPGGGSVDSFCRLSNDEFFSYPRLWVTVPPPAPPAPAPPPPRATVSAPARSTTTAPSTSAAPAPTPLVLPTPATTPSQRPGVTPDCVDCERLTGGDPVIAGAELALRYAGFQPGEQITVVMRSRPVELGTFTADSAGVVTAEVTIPASAEPGAHTLTLSGPVTGDHVVRFELDAARRRVETAAAPPSDGTAPTVPTALAGAGLVLLVAVGLLVHRRRAARSDSPQDQPAEAQPTETPISEPIT